MTPRVEFLFDFGSPNAYLCHRAIPELERRCDVKVAYVPILLGGVFKATNNVSPAVSLQGIKNKPEYQHLEIQRFCTRYGIDDLRMNPHFPVNTLQLMRGAIVAQRADFFERYVDEMYRHMWKDPKKMDDPEVMRAALVESGLDAEALLAGIQEADVKAELIANTERAVDRGVFGSPSLFVGEELFFGKDRLDDVEREIARQRGDA